MNAIVRYARSIRWAYSRASLIAASIVSREKIDAELAMGVAVCSAQGFLRLGIASVIVVGTMLLVTGQVDFLVFFVYLLAVTRVYDPINVVLQAVAELMDMSLSLERMRAIENEPVQMGSTSSSLRVMTWSSKTWASHTPTARTSWAAYRSRRGKGR